MSKDVLSAIGLLLLRVIAGFGIATHGYQKLFGGNMGGFATTVGNLGLPLPVLFAWLAALSEFLGGILVMLGLKTRIAAALVFITMSVAVLVRHASDSFSTKELALVYLSVFAALMLIGPGRFSLDRS